MSVDILTGRPAPLWIDRTHEDKFFEFYARPNLKGDVHVSLTVSPIMDKVRGELRDKVDEHIVGKCLNLESFSRVEAGDWYWGQAWQYFFTVFNQCPVGTFHICEVTKERFEAMMNMGANVDRGN